jgi:hypothetical protein
MRRPAIHAGPHHITGSHRVPACGGPTSHLPDWPGDAGRRWRNPDPGAPQPAGAARPRVHGDSPRLVLRQQRPYRIGGHWGRGRDIWHGLPVWPPEPERAIGLAVDLKALLVHRAVVAATQQGEVRERGGAAAGPVTQVMPLAERHPAAREPTAAVPVLQRPPQGRGNRPGPRPDTFWHDARDDGRHRPLAFYQRPDADGRPAVGELRPRD